MALLIGFRFGPSRSVDSGVGEDEDRDLDWAWTEVSVCGSLKGRMMKSTDLNCAERRLIVSNKADKKMIGQRNDVSVETDSEGK